jgi:hypothetical protein
MGFGRKFRATYGLAAIAAIAVMAGAVRNELLGPRIRAVPLASADPFTLRFEVSNPAFTVSVKDIDMTCLPLTIAGHDGEGRAWTAKGEPFPLDMDVDLGPRMAFEYTCPFKSSAKDRVDQVEAKVAVRYTRFGRREQAMSGTLAWDSATRVWTDAGR